MIPLNQTLSALQRSAIRVYTNLAKATPGCVMLTIGEPDFATPAPIVSAAQAALEQGLTHYAPNQGIPELRRAIADCETRRGHAVTEDQVLVTVGSTQALFTALLGILNPGEEVVVPVPAFGLYDTILTVTGGKKVPLDLTKTGFQITKEALESAITPKTKAILLNSPCNPTGTVLSRESLNAVREAILGKPIFLILDSVYQSLYYGDVLPDLSTDPSLADQLIFCQSFSKPWAMTGWRVGYLTCPDYVMDRLLLLSAGTIASVPTFLQAAAVTALDVDPGPMREVYRHRRDYVCARLKKMGLSFPEPEGAFYVFPDISCYASDSGTFCTQLIQEAGVAAVPGSCFGCEGYIRLSYCCGDGELESGLNRLEDFLGRGPV